jgi:hypothetical protein
MKLFGTKLLGNKPVAKKLEDNINNTNYYLKNVLAELEAGIEMGIEADKSLIHKREIKHYLNFLNDFKTNFLHIHNIRPSLIESSSVPPSLATNLTLSSKYLSVFCVNLTNELQRIDKRQKGDTISERNDDMYLNNMDFLDWIYNLHQEMLYKSLKLFLEYLKTIIISKVAIRKVFAKQCEDIIPYSKQEREADKKYLEKFLDSQTVETYDAKRKKGEKIKP